ncbi:MAG: hypothetical protein C0467_30880 [Planctomycetaceae bacterium]|nr:hypothetical protein [Planctomycetaceae bacterium]
MSGGTIVNSTQSTITTKTLDKATLTSGFLTVSQICRSIPGARGNRGMSPSAVTRWIVKGCPGRSGVRVKLPATRVGSRWLIDPTDLDAFFAALAATDTVAPATPQKSRTATQRREASERAARELERRGA